MTTQRQAGTNPRAQGTSPRQRGTNPRALTTADLHRIEKKLDRALALLEVLAQEPVAPTQAVHDPDRGMFLPGTGWVRDDGHDVT